MLRNNSSALLLCALAAACGGEIGSPDEQSLGAYESTDETAETIDMTDTSSVPVDAIVPCSPGACPTPPPANVAPPPPAPPPPPTAPPPPPRCERALERARAIDSEWSGMWCIVDHDNSCFRVSVRSSTWLSLRADGSYDGYVLSTTNGGNSYSERYVRGRLIVSCNEVVQEQCGRASAPVAIEFDGTSLTIGTLVLSHHGPYDAPGRYDGICE